ncbi:MAG: energy transducer TonB, partial [Bacteroidia bacterium]|nr:energy transducer TonB [Bacteroidia bacterium]
MKRKNLIIGLLAFFFCSIYSGLNAQDYPLSGEFIFVDNPPTPLNLGDVRASIGYPEDAVKENIEGTVVCRVLVDSQGNYVQHLIMSNPTGILQRAVSKKVNQLKFSPAIAEGKAVSYWINIPFKFRLINENTKKLEELAEAMTDSL